MRSGRSFFGCDAGVSRREAGGRLGIEAHQALDWDKGIRVFSKGRIYPDGRIVLYRPSEILANVKSPRTAWVQGERVALARVEQVIDPRYLSLLERERLKDLQSTGLSVRGIAAAMGRAPSTISRELRRNTVSRHGYLPHNAHRTSAKRRERPRASKLAAAGPLHDYVAAKLAKRWSPEQISQRLRRDFPHDEEMRVSGETIYQAVYVHLHGELKREFARSLRRGRSARKAQRNPDARSGRDHCRAQHPICCPWTSPGGTHRRSSQRQPHCSLLWCPLQPASHPDLGSRCRDERTPQCRDVHEHEGLFLRSRFTLATWHEREHERAATPILTPAQRPQNAKPRRTHRHRRRTQRATPENPQLGHSRRTNV